MGGLPDDAPAAPKTPYKYPAVHDMPPPRSDTPLTDDQLIKMQSDLQSTRDSQVDKAAKEKAQADADFTDTSAPAAAAAKPGAAKKQPAAAKK